MSLKNGGKNVISYCNLLKNQPFPETSNKHILKCTKIHFLKKKKSIFGMGKKIKTFKNSIYVPKKNNNFFCY